jgi:CheY-like chemotaxis protein
MQERLLSALSHHLRVPLNAISGGLPQLRSGSEQARENALAVLERSVTAQAALIANLHAAVELIAPEPPAAFERVDVASIVSPAVASLADAARTRRVTVQWRPPAAPLPVTADRRYLLQAITRLFRSALASTPAGGRWHVLAGRSGGGRRVRICVMSPVSPRGRIAAGRAAGRRPRAGGRSDELDICSALAREIIIAHGGSVGRRRTRGGRQAMVILLPLAGQPADSGRRPRPGLRQRPPRPARRVPAPEGRLPKVLLVDDYRDALDVWSFFLRSSGYDVFTAASGPEALAHAERYRPDVILLDLQLPGMSGFETARALRATPAAATTPLMAVTGYSGTREHDEAMAAGVDAVMVKPVQPAALLQRIEQLTQDVRGSTESSRRS